VWCYRSRTFRAVIYESAMLDFPKALEMNVVDTGLMDGGRAWSVEKLHPKGRSRYSVKKLH
jgi:hypothetical protein